MVVGALGQVADGAGKKQRRREAGQAEGAGDRVAGTPLARCSEKRLLDLL